MPRRKAIRLSGAAFAMALVPGLRTRRAQARGAEGCGVPGICSKGTVCGFDSTDRFGNVGCNKGCCQNTGDPDADLATAVCCNQNHEAGSWCCAKGYLCGSGANTAGDPNCRCPGEELSDGSCGCPPKTKRCGQIGGYKCCPEGISCCIGSSDTPHCCKSEEEVCAAKAGFGPSGSMSGRGCCPKRRIGENQGKPFCCPSDTIAVGVSRTSSGARSGGSCCPSGDRRCCSDVRCKDKEICMHGRCREHRDGAQPTGKAAG